MLHLYTDSHKVEIVCNNDAGSNNVGYNDFGYSDELT